VHGWEKTVVMTSLMLVCAVFASLALGVLLAYGICQAMFRLFRVHSIAAAKNRVAATDVSAPSRG
jgi:hypothetical protein